MTRHIITLDIREDTPEDVVAQEFERIGKLVSEGFREGEVVVDGYASWWTYKIEEDG